MKRRNPWKGWHSGGARPGLMIFSNPYILDASRGLDWKYIVKDTDDFGSGILAQTCPRISHSLNSNRMERRSKETCTFVACGNLTVLVVAIGMYSMRD